MDGTSLGREKETLTDDEARRVELLVADCMVSRRRKHVHDARACSLFAELHLQNGMINRLSRNLPSKHVEFPVRNLEVCRRVFVLEGECHNISTALLDWKRWSRTLVACSFAVFATCFFLSSMTAAGRASKTLAVPSCLATCLAASTSLEDCFSDTPGASFSLTQPMGLHDEALYFTGYSKRILHNTSSYDIRAGC